MDDKDLTIMGHTFVDPDLFLQSVTHTSWANEHNDEAFHNQRLEFLGDAVLELCISEELYKRFPKAREGDLTAMRCQLVNEKTLALMSRKIGIDKILRLGRGEEIQGGRSRDSVISDAFEAILAAVYLDGGFSAAQKAVAITFADMWPEEICGTKKKNAKSQLQEICQRLFKIPPLYVLLHANGPEHAKVFEVEVTLPNGKKFRGIESSAKKAEHAAALKALETIIDFADKI